MKGGVSIAFAASKGGPGKSTLTAAMSVCAAQESERVALLDVDPSHSISRWWELRGKPSNPRLFTHVENVGDDIALLIRRGWQWVLLDTPGSDSDLMEPSILAADFVVIPCKASALDVEAVQATADLCRRKRKPFAFALNDYEPTWKVCRTARPYLEDFGRVLKTEVNHRQAHLAAMGAGKSGAEYSDKRLAKPAAEELTALWQEMRTLAQAAASRS